MKISSQTNAEYQLKKQMQLRGLSFNHPLHSPSYEEISKTLYRCSSPFDLFKKTTSPNTVTKFPGYGFSAHFGAEVKNIIRGLSPSPKFAVEVGSFLGASAIQLSKLLLDISGDPVLMCIDPWCGDVNMILMDHFYLAMQNSDGDPKIFNFFMNNIINAGLEKTVIPLRCTSVIGARLLRVLEYKVDLVYLDSAHEENETFLEISLYYDLLAPGGILFGDDYTGFPAVKKDMDRFASENNLRVEFADKKETWIIRKEM